MSALVISSEEQLLEEVAKPLVQCLTPGMVVHFHGNLGAGKTTLVRYLLQVMGFSGRVKSPTYTLVESYPVSSGLTVHHFDLYRLHDPMELELMGIRDYIDPGSLCFIEWPEKGGALTPPADYDIGIEVKGDLRYVTMDGLSDQK